MDIDSSIAVGEIYSSYRSLCIRLNEPIKTGGAKINQLAHWQTCFLWEKKGNKFKITKIIRPLDKRPHKQRKDTKWYENVAIILLNKIANTVLKGKDNNSYNELVLTTQEAYLTLGLCNGNFKKLKGCAFPNIPVAHQIKLHSLATEFFYYVLNNNLKSLAKQTVITYIKTYRFSKEGENTKIRLATYDERNIIENIVQDLLHEYSLKNKQYIRSEYDIMRYHLDTEFYAERDQLLAEEGFYNCYNVYRICFTEHCLPKFREHVNSLEAQNSAKIDINEKSYKNLLKKIEDLDYVTNNDSGYNDRHEYIEGFRKLIELTIPILN